MTLGHEYLSTMTLRQPLLVGNQELEDGDITRYCWPTYKRETLADGGDHRALFTFTASDEILERWFYEYLACDFTETFAGLTMYRGYIHSMRLSYHGLVLSVSMDDLYNSVAYRYQANSGAAQAITGFSTDSDSIAIYGTKQLVATMPIYAPLATAEQERDRKLEKSKQPRYKTESANLMGSDQPGTLQVEIRGYTHTLNWQHRKSTNAFTQNADLEISDTLGSPDYVTIGTVEANSTAITREADYEPIWTRIKSIKETESSSLGWVAGCFQGKEFTYYQQDNLETITYEQDIRTKRKVTFKPGTNETIPPAMVQPIGIVFFRDIMVGRPIATTLLDDPRAILIASVEYSINGVTLKGNTADDENAKAGAITMAMQTRQLTKNVNAPTITRRR